MDQEAGVKSKTGSPQRRKRRSAEQLTNRILHAATEEFKRVGYVGATTAAIARRADVTEAQLFRCFGSKANLFREAIFEPLDEQLRAFTSEHLDDGNAGSLFQENSALYIEQLRSFVAENIDMITSLVVAQTYEKETGHGVGAIGSLQRYFERGAANMRGRAVDPKVDPKLMVRVSFVAVLACVMFREWIFPPGLASEDSINQAINTFVIEGISANHAAGVPRQS